MNTILSESFDAARPGSGFENRILLAFRNRAPDRGPGVVRFLVLVLRGRVTRFAALAALLLALMEVGRMITHEKAPTPALAMLRPSSSLNERLSTVTGSPTFHEEQPEDDFSSLSATAKLKTEVPQIPQFDFRYGFTNQTGIAERRAYRSAGVGNETTHVTPGFEYHEIDPLYERERTIDRIAGGVSAFRGGGKLALNTEAAPPAAPPVAAGLLAKSGEAAKSTIAADVAEAGQRKLIRNARTELEVVSFNNTVEKITALARAAHGYLATSGSHKQENGKLRGDVVVKVLPGDLDQFLQALHELGELKDQTISTDDVSKQYFDTSARLDNARVMEQRLVEMLKKNTGKVSDLLQVEKELGRVREDIEKMQGELKYIDAQVQFATVTITLAEKNMNVPAAFLLEERARVGLFTADVEKTYNDIRGLASAKVQVTNAHLESGHGGQMAGHINMLIAPEEAESTISKIKSFGRVQTFEVQTERVSRGGEGMSENARTEKDKVQVEVTISREEEEQSQQQTSLRIRSSEVDQNAQKLRELAEQQGGQVRHSSFNKDTDGREFANLSIRLPMQNYAGFMQSLGSFGKLEDLAVHREEGKGQAADEKTAPVDVAIQFYSRGNIVADQSGAWATLRRTLGEGAGALTWSARMIGVALAFLAPWGLAIALVMWIVRRVHKSRKN